MADTKISPSGTQETHSNGSAASHPFPWWSVDVCLSDVTVVTATGGPFDVHGIFRRDAPPGAIHVEDGGKDDSHRKDPRGAQGHLQLSAQWYVCRVRVLLCHVCSNVCKNTVLQLDLSGLSILYVYRWVLYSWRIFNYIGALTAIHRNKQGDEYG